MLEAGWSLERIGAELGRHPSTVSYWLAKHGLRPAGRDRHAPRGCLAREHLAELIARDLTIREIAAAVGRSPTTVRYWLGHYGLSTSDHARFKRRRQPRSAGHCRSHGPTELVHRRDGVIECRRCRIDAVTRWRRRAKEILVAEAGGRCQLCGYDRCIAALQFHHRDPATKRFGLGSRGLARSIESLREEAAKCVLLCSNCHVEVERGVAELPLPSRHAPPHPM